MIKNAKKNAKALMKIHYKELFICSTIYMFLQALDYLFFNVIISYLYWENFNHLLQILFLICFIGLEFVFIPVSLVGLFKKIFSLDIIEGANSEFSVKQMFSKELILKIVKSDFIPRLLRFLVFSCSTKMFYYNQNYYLAGNIFSIINIFISYKFFAVDYFITIGNEHPIKNSFKTMNCIFLKYIGLFLSFLGYGMLIAAIGVVLQYLIIGYYSANVYLPQLNVFISFGFGVGFYSIPYIFCTQYYWLNDLSKC